MHAPTGAARYTVSIDGSEVRVDPVHPSFGVRIEGLDLSRAISPATRDLMLTALEKHSLVVVAGQTLSPADELAAVRVFNEICDPELTRNESSIPGFPEIFVLSNVVRKDGSRVGFTNLAGMEWHTDGAGWPQPPLASAIYALEVPANGGGKTHFASGYLAYEKQPPARRAELDSMMCRYSFAQQLRYLAEASGGAPPPRALLERYPDVLRPLVKVHPSSGRKALWFTVEEVVHIEGLDPAASRALLEGLIQDMTSDPEIHYAHAWTPGDIAFFDNRCLLHSPSTYDYQGYRRVMHQITGRDARHCDPHERVVADA